MGTQQEYYYQLYNQGKPSVEKQIADRKQRTEDNIGLYNSMIDQHAQAGIAGYQQSIDQAPLDALEQKEDNALREAINRKIVSENMANMGITDSGLNRTQQTALTLQRGNADAEVDQKTKEYVRQLQTAIETVLLEGETKKADYANAKRTADSDWYDAAFLTLDNSAREGAATMYAAEQDAAAKITAAQIEAQQKQNDNIRSYITKRMADGVSYDVAAMEAYTVYGTGDEEKDNDAYNYTTAYQKAINAGYDESQAEIIAQNHQKTGNWDTAVASAAVSGGNLVTLYDGLNAFGRFSADYGNSAEYQAQRWDSGDWNGAISRMINAATKNLDATGYALSDTAKQYAIGKAIGEAIKGVVVSGGDNTALSKAVWDKLSWSDVAFDAVCAASGLEKSKSKTE